MIPAPVSNVIGRGKNQARILLDMSGELSQINIMWVGQPNYQALLTQEDIDEQFPGSGMTVQNVQDAMYALALVKDTIQNAIVPLTILSST